MELPALDDTIVAVASGWRASPIGIVRLSGPQAVAIVSRLTGEPLANSTAKAAFTDVRVRIDSALMLPATAFYFQAPHSYTGQAVVELHTVGCLPALRELTSRLIALGARRALPGEFTARAYLNGKLDPAQVQGVLALLSAGSADAARQAARLAGGHASRALAETVERMLDLIARIEANIDFVDEEDVQFITAAQARAEIERISLQLAQAGPRNFEARRSKPHVALVGMPNAGKSSLFNALLGTQRAIVSPLIGTTRDVVSALVDCSGVEIVLQDSAGLGPSPDEIELAAHIAAESAADQADLVLWIHDARTPWSAEERMACERIPFDRRILVHSKIDFAVVPAAPPLTFRAILFTSAVNRAGLQSVRDCVSECLASASADLDGPAAGEPARDALARAVQVIGASEVAIHQPELVSLELRRASELLMGTGDETLTESVLKRIFGQFCIGK